MKFTILILLAIGLFGCTGKDLKKNNSNDPFWTIEKAKVHLQDRENPAKWDMNMFENDLQNMNSGLILPFETGVFPVPDYDLVGKNSFKGVGNFGFPGGDGMEKKIGDKTILYNSFFVGLSDVNKEFTSNKKNEVFFQIIVLTDFVDTVNYSHLSSEIISRNHPDYIGQGFYKTKNNEIDYAAFITAERDAYAIVNMRLFDLNYGRTILIAPQKDKSFRSMQIDSPPMSDDETDSYTDKLLKEQKVIDFFTYPGNI